MMLIDVEAAIERARKSDEIVGSNIWETSEVVEFLDDCPIVDAVEVVRCKDCKHWRMVDETGGKDGGAWGHCPKLGTTWKSMYPNDFCSYGERRINGN